MTADGPLHRSHDRAPDALRPVSLSTGAMKYAEGSCLVELGDTHVLVAASVEGRVPFFLRDSGQGWITAEYAMLPRATSTRSTREVKQGRPSGRSAEIQRLIGRSLRAIVDLTKLGERTLTVDCDVIQADGGTRTASVTGAYVALYEALGQLFLAGEIDEWPLVEQVAAISVGVLDGSPLLDLDASEDRDAEVDMNIVATRGGTLVEVQGTGESRSFSRDELDALLDLAFAGVRELGARQDQALESVRNEVEAVMTRAGRRPAQAKPESDLWGRP